MLGGTYHGDGSERLHTENDSRAAAYSCGRSADQRGYLGLLYAKPIMSIYVILVSKYKVPNRGISGSQLEDYMY